MNEFEKCLDNINDIDKDKIIIYRIINEKLF